MKQKLTTTCHDRDVAGYRYIYPVISRRSGGLSIGINFNTNNTCNWRCLYCQVPDLNFGAAPAIDLALLEDELRAFFADLDSGSFYAKFELEKAAHTVKDIAISGNGEPTSLKLFAEAIEIIGSMAQAEQIIPTSQFILITNGSLIHLPHVREGLRRLNYYGGKIWFKLDSATDAGRKKINNAKLSTQSVSRNLRLAAELCPVWLQTCLVNINGLGFSEQERSAYLDFLSQVKKDVTLQGIMLYSIARPSFQPEAPNLSPMPTEQMQTLADEISHLGFEVSVNA
ncbi:MAG: radical SAM protein [Methylobacter sp.]|nr:MAG: radical SAM protein [Methylobacter sp.]PPD05007.1 MAG: radical SAM protein [Methylobacter sp.]PPD23092.1 MAG: radical SAM protein [Methylobacter sp.]PPD32001.1 MAG: radical SAM protein [Methylomonas sp.]